MGKTMIVALYRHLPAADAALEELKKNGIDRQDVSLTLQFSEVDQDPLGSGRTTGQRAVELGALVGGLTGLITGLTAISIPGIGHIIDAGLLAVVFFGAIGASIGAAIGGITGGLIDSLFPLRIPAKSESGSAQVVTRGYTLLMANISDSMRDIASEIIRRHEPITLNYRPGREPRIDNQGQFLIGR